MALGPEPFAHRYARNAEAKDLIAEKLVALIGDGGAVGMDASTTVQRAARRLSDVTDLTVLTNGPDTFNSLQGKPGTIAVLTGGRLDGRTGSLVGPVAIRSTTDFALRHVFVSAAGLHPQFGCTEQTLEDAEAKLALVEAGTDVTLAIDHTKLGAHGAVAGVAIDRISRIVTDLDPSDSRLDHYRDVCEIV